MQLFLKILSGMVNSVDPDHRSSLIRVYTVCKCHLSETLFEIFRRFIVYAPCCQNMFTQQRFKSACAFTLSDLNLPLGAFLITKDASSFTQTMKTSDCTNVQTELCLR